MNSLKLNCSFLKNDFKICKILRLIILKSFIFIIHLYKLINLIFKLSNNLLDSFDSLLFEVNKGLLPLFKFPNSYFINLQSWISLKDLNLGLTLKL